ncbi:MAG: ribose transport system substrate-binding protein [Gammaproteobacteria bacterium]|jgi:ribose transport system substrate-binding protein
MRKIVVHIAITLCLFALTSCGNSEMSGQGNADNGRPTIALIMKSLANEFFVTMAEGAKAHQALNEAQYKLIVNGIKNEVDLAQQVALIDQMISSNVDAIVIAPADSKAIVPALARAHAAGIAIVNIDNRLDKEVLRDYDLNIPFVGPNNFLGAELVGQHLALHLRRGEKVAILEGVSTTFNSQQRSAGFKKAMSDAGMDVVAQQSAQWDQTLAVTITAAILVQHPDLSAILCANDNMALGAAAAVTQAGMKEQIKIVGFDNISAIHHLIREESVLATIDQHADLLAVYGIEYALEAISSSQIIADKSTAVDLVTKDSIK